MRSAKFFRRGHPKKCYWHVVIVESPHKGHIASLVYETIKPYIDHIGREKSWNTGVAEGWNCSTFPGKG